MTEPQTEAGKALDAQFGAGQFGRVRDLAIAIEAESRNATLDEVERAVERLRRPGRSDVNYRAVLEAVKALRG